MTQFVHQRGFVKIESTREREKGRERVRKTVKWAVVQVKLFHLRDFVKSESAAEFEQILQNQKPSQTKAS